MLDLNFKIDIKGLETLMKTIRTKTDKRVVCGIPDNEEYDDGRSVAEVALINEYGLVTGNIEHPARPFLSETLKSNKKKYLRMMGGMVPDMLFGSVHDSDFTEVGREMVQDIKLGIDNWSPCDPRMNTKATIASKDRRNGNGQVVLVDSGKMKESVQWWVENGRGKK